MYENRPLKKLVVEAQLSSAERVFELGCGTGRLADELLSHHLSGSASYRGNDLSTVMVALAQARLARFGSRAEVTKTDGSFTWPLEPASTDRVFACYVIDLLREAEIKAVLNEARRVLKLGGLLCIANLTDGTTPLTRLNIWRWRWLYRLSPLWVGGCRPLQMRSRLETHGWRLRYHEIVLSHAVPSEVLVVERV